MMPMIGPAPAPIAAAFIAGQPVQVTCDVPESATAVEAWSSPGLAIHMKPSLCTGLSRKIGEPERGAGDVSFAHAIAVLIHESAHVKGVRAEDCAELYVDLGVYQVLRDYYGIPFFTPLSWLVGGQVHAHTLRLPPSYQPTLTSCEA